MGESYHIYLHSNEGNSLASNTQPKSAEESMGGAFSVKSAFKGAQQFASSGFSSTINTGVSALSKAVPAVAVAVIAAKVIDSVLETGFKHLQSYTGNYQYSMGYNNFKTVVGYIINPVSLLKKSMELHFEQQKFNDKQKEYRTLMGESTIGV